jgi:hypothetical protein
MIADLKNGASLSMGIDHRSYKYQVEPVATPVRDALRADLD